VIALVDACVAIDFLRGSDAARVVIDDADVLVASEVTRFELLAGVKPDESDDVEAFADAVEWLVVDEDVSRRAGSLARMYRQSHSGIDDADYLIAATALEFDLPLLTSNVRHFPMLPGLEPAY
jgi:predicted nucleic acid-binding protein